MSSARPQSDSKLVVKERTDFSTLEFAIELMAEKVSFMKALVLGTQRYQKYHNVTDLTGGRKGNMVATGKNIIDMFGKFQDGVITLKQFLNSLELFYKNSGGTAGDSLKFYMMDELLKICADEKYADLTPSWWQKKEFTSQLEKIIANVRLHEQIKEKAELDVAIANIDKAALRVQASAPQAVIVQVVQPIAHTVTVDVKSAPVAAATLATAVARPAQHPQATYAAMPTASVYPAQPKLTSTGIIHSSMPATQSVTPVPSAPVTQHTYSDATASGAYTLDQINAIKAAAATALAIANAEAAAKEATRAKQLAAAYASQQKTPDHKGVELQTPRPRILMTS